MLEWRIQPKEKKSRERAESQRRRFSPSSGIHEIRLKARGCRYGPRGRNQEKGLKAGAEDSAQMEENMREG